jgi:hypothetical protein
VIARLLALNLDFVNDFFLWIQAGEGLERDLRGIPGGSRWAFTT